MNPLPSYSDIDEALQKLQAGCAVAEAHGILCAKLISQCAFLDWAKELQMALPEAADVLKVEQMRHLNRLYEVSREHLLADEMVLQLLLPEDDAPLAQRLQAVSEWCQGFLYGLGMEARFPQIKEDAQAQDLLEDLIAISGVEELSEDDLQSLEQSSEAELQEVIEYVRMGVIYLYDTLHPMQTDTTVH